MVGYLLATRAMLLLHAFFLPTVSAAVGESEGLTFRIPIRIQPHYLTAGYFAEEPSNVSMLLQEQHGFKHEKNGTMLTTAKNWWLRSGKKKKTDTGGRGGKKRAGIEDPITHEEEKPSGNIVLPLPEDGVGAPPPGGGIEIPLPETGEIENPTIHEESSKGKSSAKKKGWWRRGKSKKADKGGRGEKKRAGIDEDPTTQHHHEEKPSDNVVIPFPEEGGREKKQRAGIEDATTQHHEEKPPGNIVLPFPDEDVSGYAAAVPLHLGNVILGTISLGSQLFEVIFDTGSTSLWVFGKRVGKARKIEVAYQSHKRDPFEHHFYDEDLSETLTLSQTHAEFKTKYGDGTVVTGRSGTETFKVMGSHEDLVLKDIPFGIVDTLGGAVQQSILYDGILGLGYDPTSVTPFARLTKEGMGKVFSVYMSQDGTTGEIMMGGSNPELYKGSIYYASVMPPSRGRCSSAYLRWCLEVEEVGFSSQRRTDTTTVFSFNRKDPGQYPYAVVDTGSSHVYLPYDVAEKISGGSEVLQEALFRSNDRGRVACSKLHTLPTFRIKIGAGEYLELTGPEYSYNIQRDGQEALCRVKILPRKKGSTKEFISIGAPFFRKYYTVFMGQGSGSTGRPHKIGFALSVHTTS